MSELHPTGELPSSRPAVPVELPLVSALPVSESSQVEEVAGRIPTAGTHNQLLYIETVGCQMNMLDSELVVAALRRNGYELTSSVQNADTILFNTCSVREHAEHKIYSALGRLKYSRQTRPQQVIGVMGCMAQKDQELIFQRAPQVDLVVGTGQLAEIPRLIDEARRNRGRTLAVSLDRKEGNRTEVAGSFQSFDPLREPEMRPSAYQAFVRIMFGCDKFCTYCVVPRTRGPEQSRPPSEILAETRVLADQGVREVTLLGQTVNSYRYREGERTTRLSDLLATLHEVNGIERIRFVTNYPKDMTNDLLAAIRQLPKCTRYFHVPAQSGCNEQLKRMKRGYTVEDYLEMHGRIREQIPAASISNDFIVGFCGETDASFEKSVQLLRTCRFKNSFIFKYSPRPGTKAFELYEDDIPDSVKRERNQILLALQNQISAEDNAAFIGTQVEVLVEGPSKSAQKAALGDSGNGDSFIPRDTSLQPVSDPAKPLVSLPSPRNPADIEQTYEPIQLTGRTMCDRIVVFPGSLRLAGQIARVTIEDCTPTTLTGRMVTYETAGGLLPVLMSR